MEKRQRAKVLNIILYPLSFLYGMGVAFRNWLFNVGVLKSESFDVPIISVGNITVGGTGKTPMTEYIISMLSERCRVGVLSRGYKRKTCGYVVATENSTAREIGDEPCQMKQKFPKTMVCVDANRRRGIKNMMKQENAPEVIILDDAYQHRYVKPGISILLIDYGRLPSEDKLMPLGNLREPMKSKNRANMIVVNKCPHDIKPIEMRIIRKKIGAFPYQTLYFTSIAYSSLTPLLEAEKLSSVSDYSAICLSGVANAKPFIEHVSTLVSKMEVLEYGDHYNFGEKDLKKVENLFNTLPEGKRIIIVTEKDAMRLKDCGSLPESLRRYIYYIPIRLSFINGENRSFDNLILDYVDRN